MDGRMAAGGVFYRAYLTNTIAMIFVYMYWTIASWDILVASSNYTIAVECLI